VTLRKEIFWGAHMGDDRVIEPYFNVPHVYIESDWGMHETRTGGQDGGSYVPYQLPLLERFGLSCYGCCEPLDKRWSIVEQIPKLRRVSVSPWSDRAQMAERLGDRYIYSIKPSPTDLAMDTLDEERIRAELRAALRATRDCRVEVIMKDNHTIRHDPQRVVRWVQIARQEAEALQ